MKRSERFKKFSELSSQKESNAGAELAAARSQLETQKQQLEELQSYLLEYQQQLQAKLVNSDSALVINGYQQFISSLNGAIALQKEFIRKSESSTTRLQQNWLERKVEVNKYDQAAENMRNEEAARERKVEQSESDERVMNSFRQARSLRDLEAAS